MILVDTTLWIDHLHRANSLLSALLTSNQVLMHPFVFGELAMGSLRDRDKTLHSLRRLPEMLPARDSEVLTMVSRAGLVGTGIGYIDAHLLTSVRLMPGTLLWTRDKRLAQVAGRLGLAARPHGP
jgi:predicted nucleic acid-binding protein